VTFDQSGYDLRCEWGLAGVDTLAAISDVVIVVDVLSFSTAVDIAVANGASVLPYRWRDEMAAGFAASKGAALASRTDAGGYSLSPSSLQAIPRGTALVLPSPNGSTLSLRATGTVFTACLRNAGAVAARARECGSQIAVIPAGERWSDGSLRPALEDLIGAGAVLDGLPGRLSPEAEAAVAAFDRFRHSLPDVLLRCSSGKELVERGLARDVELAADYGASSTVPMLKEDRFVDAVGL
jgi:2-phosphosulfolactate phosphatase